MKTILTLDYELFFGQNVGTPQVSMIECTNKLLTILDKFNAKAVFFVDATYILKLKKLKNDHTKLQYDYADVVQHIKKLEREGHQIQLHIHPHWLDSVYDDKTGWKLNLERYRLSNWNKEKAVKIINDCVKELNTHLKNPVYAFRAGGWCLQPFNHIQEALKDNNIWLDSTVFYNGRSLSNTHAFDFRNAPKLASWNFEDDPCIENKNGFFTEIPIFARKLSPLFYWKLALIKKLGDKRIHSSLGDGNGIQSSKKDMLRMLTTFSSSVISIDGYKSSYLLDAYERAFKNNEEYFVVIGHPKLLTPYSLTNIEKWLKLIASKSQSLILYGQ